MLEADSTPCARAPAGYRDDPPRRGGGELHGADAPAPGVRGRRRVRAAVRAARRGVRRFQSNPTDPLGLYTVFVKQRSEPARARTALLVFPPD